MRRSDSTRLILPSFIWPLALLAGVEAGIAAGIGILVWFGV